MDLLLRRQFSWSEKNRLYIKERCIYKIEIILNSLWRKVLERNYIYLIINVVFQKKCVQKEVTD